MTGQSFAEFIRIRTHTSPTTLPNSVIASLANVELEEISIEAERSHEDIFGAIAYDDLKVTTGEMTDREYPQPEDLLTKVKYLEAYLDNRWIRLDEIDLNTQKRPTDEESIIHNYSNQDGQAKYDIFRSSFWIYSGTIDTAVENGVKLHYSQRPQKLTADRLSQDIDLSLPPTTLTMGIPYQLHKTLALMTSKSFKLSRERPIPLDEEEQNVTASMLRAVDNLRSPNSDRTITATVPYNDGRQY